MNYFTGSLMLALSLATVHADAQPTRQINLVSVKSSSVQNYEFEAESAVDNNDKTRWSSAFKDNQWLEFELEKQLTLKSLQINWEGAFASEYEVLVSEDASTWTSGNWQKMYSVKNITKATEDLITLDKSVKAQYIRINCLRRGTNYGFSIFEIKLNGKNLVSPKVRYLERLAKDTDLSVCGDKTNAPEVRAQAVVDQMIISEKKKFVSGYNSFFIAPMDRFKLRPIYMTDASAGMHIRTNLFKMDRSISYPSTVALAATWEPELALRYGASIAAECRAWGADVLLGPGVNLYRSSECGRNFEYMGEDPLLAGVIATAHIKGVQSNKIMATGKHFILNNHEWARHHSDIYVDERAKREFYVRPWYRMIHEAKLGAIMSSYNLVDGEKASQSKVLLNNFLREEIGFDRFIMSDWGAVWDTQKAVMSGLDLIMPRGSVNCEKGQEKEFEANLTKMCKRTLTECYRFGLYDRESKDESFMEDYPKYEQVALETARKSVTLLKNSNHILPLDMNVQKNIVVTGPSAMKTKCAGGGSGNVKGYNHTHILSELQKVIGKQKVQYLDKPSEKQLKEAGAAVVCIHSNDYEGGDRPFKLDNKQEALIKKVLANQPNTIVVLLSGGAADMRAWEHDAKAIIHGYYGGQYAGQAIAEVLTGKVNPSGKLPFTIEKNFEDSPAFGDRPASKNRSQSAKVIAPVKYDEGIFVGYRWYDREKKEIFYPFGHGLSYTSYNYSALMAKVDDRYINLSVKITNSGEVAGTEIVQVYFSDLKSSVERPEKELAGFAKVTLKPGEEKAVKIRIPLVDLAFYDVKNKSWKVEAGKYQIAVGASSKDLRLKKYVTVRKDQFHNMPVLVK